MGQEAVVNMACVPLTLRPPVPTQPRETLIDGQVVLCPLSYKRLLGTLLSAYVNSVDRYTVRLNESNTP